MIVCDCLLVLKVVRGDVVTSLNANQSEKFFLVGWGKKTILSKV